jgi:hypothetical protein
VDYGQAIESSGGFKYRVFRDGKKSFKDEYDQKCRESSKTRRSVDAYPDFQSDIRTHRLLAGGCSVIYPLDGLTSQQSGEYGSEIASMLT